MFAVVLGCVGFFTAFAPPLLLSLLPMLIVLGILIVDAHSGLRYFRYRLAIYLLTFTFLGVWSFYEVIGGA